MRNLSESENPYWWIIIVICVVLFCMFFIVLCLYNFTPRVLPRMKIKKTKIYSTNPRKNKRIPSFTTTNKTKEITPKSKGVSRIEYFKNKKSHRT